MIGLFFGNTFKHKFGNDYGNIELDAVLQEEHEWSAEATSNPVEEGAPITDHVIEQADKLRVSGFVSNTPVTLSGSIASFLGLGSSAPKTQEVFNLLHELLKLKQPMTVYTKYRIYDDMVMTAVNIPRSATNGDALEFNVEFVHIRKVATQIVDVPNGISSKKASKSDAATGRKAESQKDAGVKQPETVTRPSSTLARLFN